MTAPLKQIADDLMKLSAAERIELAEALYVSVEGTPAEVERAWEDEINRRIDDYEAGRSKPIPAGEVHAMIQRTLDEIRRVSPGSKS